MSGCTGENGTAGAGLKRQELCRLLSTLLLSDLDFALDKKAEQDLWNFAFRLPIQALQNKAKEQKHCLVHVGDLARYRGQSHQAETFYRRALDLSPNNGQPYNQLALLEAASGAKLSSVFYYMRSLAVQFPFPNAATNLQKLFSNFLSDGFGGNLKTRHTAFEYIQSFLHVHARLHLSSEVGKLECMLGELSLSLTALVIAERLDSWQLVEMAGLCLFAWEQPSTAQGPVLELLAGLLSACLDGALGPRDSARLGPPIKVVLDWLLFHPPLFFLDHFLRRPQIWKGLCRLLNDFNTHLPDKWKSSTEDWELRGFLPLAKSHSQLDFSADDSSLSEEEVYQLRASRLLRLGQSFSQLDRSLIFLGEDNVFYPVPCDLAAAADSPGPCFL
ncbi:SMG7 [Cordylochernes scorpioides]|uniref:SMG7 n=1 Tax=Cordylochernes scorpioides TaxID=51811 RepID=A0ABY6K3J2_9ARAC|nr:SMG7 [Cordylochernes scorpioides]